MNKFAVLIVDDSQDDRYLLKRRLKEINKNVTVFEKENGQEAIDYFVAYNENQTKYPDEFPPLAVFLDINMPLVDGFGFLEKFRELRKEHDLDTSFIVMFSSSERVEEKEKAFSYEYVKGYLTKGSYSTETLKAEIEKLQIQANK